MLDHRGITYQEDEDCAFMVLIGADHVVARTAAVFFFIINERSGRLHIQAFAEDLVLPDALLAHGLVQCNDWNSSKAFGKAYVTKEGQVMIDQSYLLDEQVSEDFIIENLMGVNLSVCREFFKEFLCDAS